MMSDPKPTRIHTDVDYARSGKQVSFLRLPHSDNTTPFGFVPIPIAVIGSGNGPTVLLTGGTHGDEYEGQVILRRLIHELDPDTVSGRLIVLPAINYLAAQADARCWPGDNINMNRVYPGDPDVTPTPALAHYVETRLLPMCDFGVDIHSGGRVSDFLPCAYVRHGGADELMQKKIAACDAFAAPLTVVVKKTSDNRSLIAAGDRNGVPMISCELGGIGSISIDAMQVGTRGVYNVLHHLGGARAGANQTAADPLCRDQGPEQFRARLPQRPVRARGVAGRRRREGPACRLGAQPPERRGPAARGPLRMRRPGRRPPGAGPGQVRRLCVLRRLGPLAARSDPHDPLTILGLSRLDPVDFLIKPSVSAP